MTFPRRTFLALLLALAGLNFNASGADDGFKPIFNGKNLEGWDGNPAFWSAKDGMIVGKTTPENPTKGNTFLIWRAGAVDDFEIHFSYRINGGNSGLQYRSKDLGNWVVGGYQADIDAGNTFTGILYEERGPRQIAAQRGQKVILQPDAKKEVTGSVGSDADIKAALKKGDWNDYVITAHGNHFVQSINGKTTVDVTDNDLKNRMDAGIIAFQLHAGEPMTVEFKNIVLKRFPVEGKKKIVLVAGTPSHAKGDHEFNAGVQLMHKALANQTNVLTAFYLNGWPKDPTAFDNADAILFYMDGGGGHAAIQGDHIQQLDKLAAKGVGLAMAHYAVEVPKDKGGPEWTKWTGGYFEEYYSINPTWEADFTNLPDHPITRGVKPFKIRDEWYYNMRFADKGVIPLLTAIPPDSTRQGKEDAHGGNDFVRNHKGRPEHMMWATERADGGRGFGFTGGHYHQNWNNDQFRKIFLNALLWVAKAAVPPNGVESILTLEDLAKNLDEKK